MAKKQKREKLRGERFTVSLYFLTLLVGFPLCFIALREVTVSALSSVTWDNVICGWIDARITISPSASKLIRAVFSSSSCKWLADILTLPLSVWTVRFLGGAVEETTYTYQITALEIVEVFFRWMGFSGLFLLAIPLFTVIFFRTLIVLNIWEPIAFLATCGLCLFLFLWSYQYPNRRLAQVTKVYEFKKLKYDGKTS